MALQYRKDVPVSGMKRLSLKSPDESVYKLVTQKEDPVKEEEEYCGIPKLKTGGNIKLPMHIDSSQINEVLNPPKVIREVIQRRGITPRNHAKHNKLAIAETSAKNHARKQDSSRRESSLPPPIRRSMSKEYQYPSGDRFKGNSTDFIAKNALDASTAPRRISNSKLKSPDPQKQNENFGKVPAYLIRRKFEFAQAAEQRIRDEEAKSIPPGCFLMEEDDKQTVLKTLRENKAECEKRLSSLPLVIYTPSQIRAKAEIDQELLEIEDAIKRFSRPKVYVSYND